LSEEGKTLVSEIREQAEKDSESTISSAKRVADREVRSAERKARARKRQAQSEVERRVSEITSRAEARARSEAARLRLQRRHELVERMLSDALSKLRERPRDDAYLALLERLIREGAGELGLEEAVVTAAEPDREFLASEGRFSGIAGRMAEEQGLKLSLSDEALESAGGVVVSSGDGRVSFYNTFEERADRRRSRLRRLFNEEVIGKNRE